MCSLLCMALGSAGVQVMGTRVEWAMDLSSTTASAFPSQPATAKIFWFHVYIHTQTHTHAHTHTHARTYFSLYLCVYIEVLFPLHNLSLFFIYLYKFYNIFSISFSILQNSKCLKRKYFCLRHTRRFLWVYSVYNISLRIRYLFLVIWHSRCPIFNFFFLKQNLHAKISILIKVCFELLYLCLAADQILLPSQTTEHWFSHSPTVLLDLKASWEYSELCSEVCNLVAEAKWIWMACESTELWT